jgi:predicted Rossmann fold nucleotide-binding protein DprA/Smf involved in DNA uptake
LACLEYGSGVRPSTYRNLLARFHNSGRIFAALTHALAAVRGFGEKTIQAIKEFPAERMATEELKKVRYLSAFILRLHDQGYAKNLLQIYAPPPLFVCMWDLCKGII